MELAEFKALLGVKWDDLAELTGVPASNLCALAKGSRDASFETARQIEDRTGGKVTPNDLNVARRRFLRDQHKNPRTPGKPRGRAGKGNSTRAKRKAASAASREALA